MYPFGVFSSNDTKMIFTSFVKFLVASFAKMEVVMMWWQFRRRDVRLDVVDGFLDKRLRVSLEDCFKDEEGYP